MCGTLRIESTHAPILKHMSSKHLVLAAAEYYLRYVVPEGYGMLWVGDAPPDRRLVQYDISQPRIPEVAPSPHESAQAGQAVVEVTWAVALVGSLVARALPGAGARCTVPFVSEPPDRSIVAQKSTVR